MASVRYRLLLGQSRTTSLRRMVRDLYCLFVVSVLSAFFPSAKLSRRVRGIAEHFLAHAATRRFRALRGIRGALGEIGSQKHSDGQRFSLSDGGRCRD